MVSRLEDLCGIELAIVLANKLEFKKEILRLRDLDLDYLFHDETEPWFENMEEKVLDALKELPFVLRNKIPICIVIFCLSQSIEWAKFHKKEFDLPVDYSCHFLTSSFFTSKGLINKEKAAREILKDTEISSAIRFCMACYYCFSDVIPALWEQLPEDTRRKIGNESCGSGLGIGGNNKMVELWSNFLLGKHQIKMEKGETFSLYKFKKSLESYNSLGGSFECYEKYKNCKDVPFKNCFEELNELDIKSAVIFSRDELIDILSDMESFESVDSDTISTLFPLQLGLPFLPYIEMIKFLLSHLDEEQLKVFFQPYVLYDVLFHLLNWPYPNLFMDIVNQFLDILPKDDFCLLLLRIVSLMKNVSGKLCDYHNILKAFWNASSSSLKTFFFRFEGIIKMVYDMFPEGEDGHSDFRGLIYRSVICDLFESPFTIEDEEIIRLIFESATLEEKSAFVRINGNTIGKIAFDACDLGRLDLFIELCIPNERIISFKKGLFNDQNVKETLSNLVIYDDNLEELQNFLNWALCAEEIKEWQQGFFLLYLKQEDFYDITSDNLKCIDKFLEWSLSSDEIKDFKESLVSDVENIANRYKNSFIRGNFQAIDCILEWIFSSENEIVKFKTGLALEIVRHRDYSFTTNGLSLLKKFVDWVTLPEEECKDFKRQVAFREEVIEFYSKFVAQSQLHQTDEFIQWAELTETEVKEFKKLLVEKRNVISACVSYIVNGKPGFIKELLNWVQFSEEEVKEFYSLLPEELYLYTIDITDKKTKFISIKNFFSVFTLSENEIKRHKKNILSKNIDIIEYFVMENKWDEVEELLSWGLTSKTKLCINVCLNLILHERFDDVDKFCNLIGICHSLKKTLLNEIIFDSRIYQMVSRLFVLLRDNRIEEILNFLSSHNILSTKWEESFLNWYYETEKQSECYDPKCCRIFRWHDYNEHEKHSDYGVLCGLCKTFVADSKRFSEMIEKRINKSDAQQKRKLEPSLNNSTNETKRGRHC